VYVNSPDPLSKFHEDNDKSSDPVPKRRVGGGGGEDNTQLLEHSVSSSCTPSKASNGRSHHGQKPSSHKTAALRSAEEHHVSPLERKIAFAGPEEYSPDGIASVFNDTVSPFKPNYKQVRKLIQANLRRDLEEEEQPSTHYYHRKAPVRVEESDLKVSDLDFRPTTAPSSSVTPERKASKTQRPRPQLVARRKEEHEEENSTGSSVDGTAPGLASSNDSIEPAIDGTAEVVRREAHREEVAIPLKTAEVPFPVPRVKRAVKVQSFSLSPLSAVAGKADDGGLSVQGKGEAGAPPMSRTPIKKDKEPAGRDNAKEKRARLMSIEEDDREAPVAAAPVAGLEVTRSLDLQLGSISAAAPLAKPVRPSYPPSRPGLRSPRMYQRPRTGAAPSSSHSSSHSHGGGAHAGPPAVMKSRSEGDLSSPSRPRPSSSSAPSTAVSDADIFRRMLAKDGDDSGVHAGCTSRAEDNIQEEKEYSDSTSERSTHVLMPRRKQNKCEKARFSPRLESVDEGKVAHHSVPRWLTIFKRGRKDLSSSSAVATHESDPLGNTVFIHGKSSRGYELTPVADLFVSLEDSLEERSVNAEEATAEVPQFATAGRVEYDKAALTTHFPRKHEDYAAENGSDAFGFECIHRRDGAALKTFVDNHKCVSGVIDDVGNTLITVAAFSGWLKAVKFFIKRGVDVNKVNSYGLSPLHYAIEFEHFDIRDYLIKKGANVLY
jgi:hypothetical protein